MGKEFTESEQSLFKLMGIHYGCALGIPLMPIVLFFSMLGKFNVPFWEDFWFSYWFFLTGPFLGVVINQDGFWGSVIISLILRFGCVAIVVLILRHLKIRTHFIIAIGIQLVISFLGVMLWIGAH